MRRVIETGVKVTFGLFLMSGAWLLFYSPSVISFDCYPHECARGGGVPDTVVLVSLMVVILIFLVFVAFASLQFAMERHGTAARARIGAAMQTTKVEQRVSEPSKVMD